MPLGCQHERNIDKTLLSCVANLEDQHAVASRSIARICIRGRAFQFNTTRADKEREMNNTGREFAPSLCSVLSYWRLRTAQSWPGELRNHWRRRI